MAPSTATFPTWLSASEDGLYLRLHIVPNASRTRLVGVHGDRLKVSLQSPPTDGKANAALTAFLAKLLDCPKRHVELIRGSSQRRKTIHVEGVSPAAALSALEAVISGNL